MCAMHRHTRLTTLLLPVSLYCISSRHKGLSSAIVTRNKGCTPANNMGLTFENCGSHNRVDEDFSFLEDDAVKIVTQ